MCADTQPLRNLCRRIAPLDNLRHGFPFELVGKIKFAHIGLLASNLGKKVSTNLGAIQTAGISDAAYYTWRKKFGRMARPQLRELKALEKENQRLKKMDVLEALYPLLLNRGKPEYIRSDDGPEFTSEPFKDWLTKISIKPINIYPGSPWDETVKKSLQLERFQVERIQ